MLISPKQFESTLGEANRLGTQTAKHRLRKVQSKLFDAVNTVPTDTSAFARLMLLAYLTKPTVYHANRSENRQRLSQRSVHVVFEVDPIVYQAKSTGEGVPNRATLNEVREGQTIEIDNSAILAPLKFRAFLEVECYAKCQINSIGFGCLEVNYLMDVDPQFVKEILDDSNTLVEVCESLSVAVLKVGNTIIYSSKIT